MNSLQRVWNRSSLSINTKVQLYQAADKVCSGRANGLDFLVKEAREVLGVVACRCDGVSSCSLVSPQQRCQLVSDLQSFVGELPSV